MLEIHVRAAPVAGAHHPPRGAGEFISPIDGASLITALRSLRLRRMLHFTASHKFSFRLDAHSLDRLMAMHALSVASDCMVAVIDSASMQSESALYYYIRTMLLESV